MSVGQSLQIIDSGRGEVAEDIGACLDMTQGTYPDLQGDYIIMKRWYLHASVRIHNPSWEDLDKVSREYNELYQQEDPSYMVRPVPTRIKPF